jgi:hypothetical protein
MYEKERRKKKHNSIPGTVFTHFVGLVPRNRHLSKGETPRVDLTFLFEKDVS